MTTAAFWGLAVLVVLFGIACFFTDSDDEGDG